MLNKIGKKIFGLGLTVSAAQAFACDYEFKSVKNSTEPNSAFVGVVQTEEGEFGVQIVPLNKESHLKLQEGVASNRGVCLEGTRSQKYFVYSVVLK